MATIDTIRETYLNLITSLGRDALASAYPRDFEVYLLAIELVDFNDNSIDYLMFPVMPSNISVSNNERTSIQKTLRGTTIIRSNSFVPKDLSISGNFGRKFKSKPFKQSESNYSMASGVYSADEIENPTFLKPTLTPYFKTGYGLTKDLQSIIDKAKGFSNTGKPFKLIVYNPALGENYLCELTKTPLTLKQEESGSNMIWSYSLNLKIIGNLDASPKIMVREALKSNIQKGVSSISKLLKPYLA